MYTESDILIIGAGVTGCAVAKELSRYNASVTVLERGDDVANGATKANSGIVHAGYDAAPGSHKAYYNVLGAQMFPKLCAELNVPYCQNGALVIALDESERSTIEELLHRGIKNGVKDLSILDHDQVLELEPSVNPSVVCALYIPSSAIVSPYELAFALADDAALNGVRFIFNETVLSVSFMSEGYFLVKTESGMLKSRVLVNCSGSSGADIHNQLSAEKLSMIHRRGQYYLLDRTDSQPFIHTVFQCPSSMGKGVLVTPTVHGNLLLGPTAEDITDPFDTSTTAEGLHEVIRKASLTWPALSIQQNITNFSGIRAHLSTDDFYIGACEDCRGLFEAIGIESPGLSSAPAIGTVLSGMIASYLNLDRKTEVIPLKHPAKPFHDMSDTERAEAVKADPAYGRIVCRCETVTEAEIRCAINRPVGARSIDAVKRRTRAGMGRCQGGFCMPRVAAIIAEETGVSITEITKNGGNSFLLAGKISDFLMEDSKHE